MLNSTEDLGLTDMVWLNKPCFIHINSMDPGLEEASCSVLSLYDSKHKDFLRCGQPTIWNIENVFIYAQQTVKWA